MKLDVGCAWNPHGDINVDISRSRLKGNILNSIVADVHHLPFKDKVFSMVYAHALLEHVDKPTEALKEMIRVSSEEVVFIVPHRLFGGKRHPKGHRHFFGVLNTRSWVQGIVGFMPLLKIEWRGFPSPTFPLFQIPYLIEVRICLAQKTIA